MHGSPRFNPGPVDPSARSPPPKESTILAGATVGAYCPGVKHVTMAEKSLLIGDEAADLLLSYAALVAQIGRGDHVSIRAIGADGDEVTVGFLLNSGTVLLIETSTGSTLSEPDNRDAIQYMSERLASYSDVGDELHLFNAAEDGN